MQFSKRFITRYKDNESMQDTISNINDIVDNIQVPDSSYSEIIFETLYGLKEVLKKENYDVDMNLFYKRLKENLTKIEIKTYDPDDRVAGCYWYNEHKISISDKYLDNKYRIIVHEIMHSIADGGDRERFNYTISEMYTEGFAAKICDIITEERKKQINFGSGCLVQDLFYREISSTGYAYTNFYQNALEMLYPRENLYKFYLEGDSSNFSEKKLSNLEEINALMELIYEPSEYNIKNTEILINTEIKIQEKIHSLLLEKNGNDLGQYLLDCEKSKGFTIYQDGGNDIFKILKEDFLLKEVYFKMQNITNEEEKLKELNPLTRSENCTLFLAAIEEIQKTQKHYSTEDILNMSWNIDENRTLHINIGSDTISTLNYQSPQISFYTLINENQITNNLNNYIKQLDKYPLAPSAYREYLISNIASNVKGEHFKSVISNYNFEEITGTSGDNILHTLALNSSQESAKKLINLYNVNPEKVNKLLNEPNEKGLTPLDYMYGTANIKCLNAVFQLKMENHSTSELGNYKYPVTDKKAWYIEPVYEPSIIIAAKDGAPVVSDILKRKQADINVQDSKGNTLAILFAKGEIKNISLNDLIANGADFKLKDNTGKTAIDIFFEKKDTKSLYALVNRGIATEEISKTSHQKIASIHREYNLPQEEELIKNYLKICDKALEKDNSFLDKQLYSIIKDYLTIENTKELSRKLYSVLEKTTQTEEVFENFLDVVRHKSNITYNQERNKFYLDFIDKILEKDPSLAEKHLDSLLSTYCQISAYSHNYTHDFDIKSDKFIEKPSRVLANIENILSNYKEVSIYPHAIDELLKVKKFDIIDKIMDLNINSFDKTHALISSVNHYYHECEIYSNPNYTDEKYRKFAYKMIENGANIDGWLGNEPHRANACPVNVPLVLLADFSTRSINENLKNINDEFIRDLLDRGANPLQSSDKQSCIASLAVHYNRVDWLEMIIDAGNSLDKIKKYMPSSYDKLSEEVRNHLEQYEEKHKLSQNDSTKSEITLEP